MIRARGQLCCVLVSVVALGCAQPAAPTRAQAAQAEASTQAPQEALPTDEALIAQTIPAASQLQSFKVLQASSRRLALMQHREHVHHHRAAVVLEDGRLGVFRFSDDDESLPQHRWEAAINAPLGVVGVISLGGEGSIAAFQVVRFDETSGRWLALEQLKPPYHMCDLVRLTTTKDGALALKLHVDDCAGCGLEGDYIYQSTDHGQSWSLLSSP